MKEETARVIDLLDIFDIFRRQKKLLALTTVVVVGLAVAFLVQATPRYTATALLLVDPAGKNLLSADAAVSNAASDNARVESDVEILKSDGIALKTIRDSRIYLTDEFGQSFGILDKMRTAIGLDPAPALSGDVALKGALSRFRDALSVRRLGLTYLIGVSVTSRNAERAATLANTHAQTYIDDQVATKVEASLGARDLLQGQLDQSRQALASSDGALTAYIATNVDKLQVETGSAKVLQLRQQLLAADAETARTTEVRDLARAAFANSDWDQLAQQVNDSTLRRLAQQRKEFEARLAGLAPDSAEAVNLASGLADLNQQLALTGQQRLSDLERSVQASQESSGEIVKTLRDEVLSSPLGPETLTDIYSLQQEAQIAQRQYDTLLTRVRDIQTQALVQVADTRIVSAALAPQGRSYPNVKLVLAIGLMTGLFLGAVLALSNEYLYGGIVSADQLANVVPAKVAAVVPRVTLTQGQLGLADMITDEPMSLFSESFRKLRASIDRQVKATAGRGKVVVVTSAIPAEGKSVVALALARTYALAGKNTILIDADLRKPSQHLFIGVEPQSGLLEYLTRSSASDQDFAFYESDPKSGLGIVLGQRRSSIPTDAPLQTQAFANMIASARQAFDVVIIDTAPLIPVVDARYVAPHADAIVLCVRFGLTRQADVRAAYDQLVDSINEDAVIFTSLDCYEGKSSDYRQAGYYGSVTE